MTRVDRRRAQRTGLLGEWVAAIYLTITLHRILAWRMKTSVGEIDLIAQRGQTIVFVEVKVRRRRADEGMALEAVNQHRIVRAARYFVSRNAYLADNPQRFDVIFLAPWSWPRHVKNAFEGD